MCDPAKEVENLGKSASDLAADFDKTVGVAAISREATNAAKAIGSTVEAIAQDPRKLAAVGIMVAFPGAAASVGSYLLPSSVAAAYPAMATIVGQTAINAATNGGDVKQAVTSALIAQGAPELTKYVANSYATEGVSKAITDWAAKATVNAGISTALGKDPTAALLFSGAQAATDAVLDYTGVKSSLQNLPPAAASAVKAAITAKVMNIDPAKAVAQDLVNGAIRSAQGMVKAQEYAKYNKLTALTEEQLNQINPETVTDANGIRNFVLDANAQNDGWKDSYEKAIAEAQGITKPEEYRNVKDVGTGDFGPNVQGTVYADGRYKPYDEDEPRKPTAEEAETIKGFFERSGQQVPQTVIDALAKEEEPAAKKDDDVVKTLTDAGLHDDLADDVDLNKIVETEASSKKPTLDEAMEAGKSGDKLAQINMMRDIVGLPPFNSLEEYEASEALKERPAENEAVDSGKPNLQEAIDAGKSGDKLAQINMMREIVGLPVFNSLEEYEASESGKGNLIEETEKPAEKPTLQEAIDAGKSGDALAQINMMREIVGLPAFNSIEEYEAYEEAEQAKRVTEFGKDLTGGGVQDSGVGDTKTGFYEPDASGTGAYKYDPTSGTYTYTSDDGSTLTLDADGNIVGSTESTDTSWTGLTDTATGNLKLPKLPGGKLPAVKPPAKKVTTTKPTTTTTTTGVGNTAITTGSNTAVQTGGGLNIAALMAIMGGLGGNQQPQQPQIETYNPGKGFEYFDWESDPFAPKTKDKTNPTGQPKMAGGGSIDELLEILRRSGI